MHSSKVYLCLFLLLCGCAEPEFNSVRNPDIVFTARARPLQIRAVAKEKPNQYQVEIKIKKSEVSGFILEKISTDMAAAQIFVDLGPLNEGVFTDNNVTAGSTYSYRLKPSLDASPALEVSVDIPQDYVVARRSDSPIPRTVMEIRGFNRLFFERDSILFSSGQSLSIDVEEIISDNGRIESWAEDYAATDGSVGSTPLGINISSRKISGTLEVINRGQKGGKGSMGLKGAKAEPGGVGPKTKLSSGPGEYGTPIGKFCSYIGDPIYSWRFQSFYNLEDWTHGHPGRGQKGKTGFVGGSGYPGSRGGDGGEIRVSVPESELEKLKLASPAGLGGDGGSGGPGGVGGDGGRGGEILDNHVCDGGRSQCCHDAPVGPPGDVGPVGPSGPTGMSGSPGNITLDGGKWLGEVFP